MAIAKVHLSRKHKNIYSLKQQTNIATDFFPPLLPIRSNAAYVTFFRIDPEDNIVHINLTSRFPVTSASGIKYILVLTIMTQM